MNTTKLYLVSLIIKFIPSTRGFGLKSRMYRWAGAKIGTNVRIVSSATIIGNGELSIGDNTWIGHEAMILCSSDIRIGNNCDIAPRVYIDNGTHKITPDKDRIGDIETSEDIRIGNGCWLGANSSILPGVTIGDKCVVAAGAVVTRSYKGMSLLAGVPAVIKKDLSSEGML